MRKAIKIAILLYIIILLRGPKDPTDEQLLKWDNSDSLSEPYEAINPIDTSQVFIPRDSTPYKGNWIDVN